MNVLFLAADDLRPQFHCYGVDWMHTPNIDALAALELYDHQKDPQENHNLANHPENAALIKRLTTQLQNGWQQAKP